VGPVVHLKSLALALVAPLLVLAACSSPGDFLRQRTYAPPSAALERLAVIPFYPHRTYEGSRLLGSVPPDVATERVTRLVVDAISEQGIDVVAPAEVAAAIEGVPRSTAAIDAAVLAELAARKLGATGVLLGEVLRFRDPRGVSSSARHPASVAYQVTLYEAPEGFKLWTARFDETQTVPPAERAREPGDVEMPLHWLSAGELARRGADAVASSLVESR
jgi:hypothetical protein